MNDRTNVTQDTQGRPRIKSVYCEIEIECSCGEITWHTGMIFGEARYNCPQCNARIYFGLSGAGPFCFRAKDNK